MAYSKLLFISMLILLSSFAAANDIVYTNITHGSSVNLSRLENYIGGKYTGAAATGAISLYVNGTKVSQKTIANNTWSGFSAANFSHLGLLRLTINTSSNTTGEFWLYVVDTTPLTPNQGSGYIAIALILGIIILFLVLVADRLEIVSYVTQEGTSVPVLKILVLIIAGWLSVATIDVAVGIAESSGYVRLVGAITGIFSAMMWIMVAMTLLFILGVAYIVFKYATSWGEQLI